jgi:hypothetical protein
MIIVALGRFGIAALFVDMSSNNRTALDAAMALLLHTARHGSRASERGRSTREGQGVR